MAAQKYDSNPNSQEYENDYSNAQKDLADQIGSIVKLTNNNTLMNTFGGLEDLLKSGGRGVKVAEELMKFIEEMNLKMKNNSDFTVEGAKQITEKTKELSSILRQMGIHQFFHFFFFFYKDFFFSAKDEPDPKFKEQFNTFANGLNDSALQIKILSAVNLAEGGSKNTNQVTAACNVLKNNLVGLVSSLHSASLQSSIRQTNKQAEAIKKLAEAFQNQNK